jgi:UrcA family protein
MFGSATRSSSFLGLGSALAIAAAAASAPALAQSVPDEVVVIGRYPGPDADTRSAVVSYRDLDLTTQAGRDILQERVEATANELCRQMREGNMTSSAILPSCEQDTYDNARPQMRLAYSLAQPRYVAVVPPPPGYVAPAGSSAVDDMADDVAAAPSYGAPAAATVETQTVTNGPVPDTRRNRQIYGGPMSNGGRATVPAGN